MESIPTELLWRSALAVIPLALIVAAISRWTPCRPSTRHALWLVVLVLLVVAPLLPRVTLPQLPAGPPAVTVDAPPREFPIRREGEATAPTASSGPPATASINTPRPLVAVEGDDPQPRATKPAGQRQLWRPDPPSIVMPDDRVTSSVESAPRETLGAPIRRRSAFGYSVPAPAEKIASVPPEPPAQPAAAGGAWRQWMVQLGAIRDAVMSLPPIPARVWLGGILALLLVGALRIERSRRVVRAATAAPPSVERMVDEASRELRLRRPPFPCAYRRRCGAPCAWQWRAPAHGPVSGSSGAVTR